jgi:hypothetical protein
VVSGGDTCTATCDAAYEPPALRDLGSFTTLTQNICVFGKQFGGSDGITFMGISVPISNCSA